MQTFILKVDDSYGGRMEGVTVSATFVLSVLFNVTLHHDNYMSNKHGFPGSRI